MVYFAGHGVQIENVNYLLPVDSRATSPDTVADTGITLGDIEAAFHPTAKAKLLIADACRDNPFATRSIGAKRGLARAGLKTPGMVALYSAHPDTVALDGAQKNSPFARAFASVFSSNEPLSLSDAFVGLVNEVSRSTDQRQVPYWEGSLTEHIELRASTGGQGAKVCQAPMANVSTLGKSEEWLGLSGKDKAIDIDNRVQVCPQPDGIYVSGPGLATNVSCKQILDPENGGSGFHYASADGDASHLWFYADPDDSARTLQMGVYHNDAQAIWMDTGWPICR